MSTTGDETERAGPTREEIDASQVVTHDLIGVALRSPECLDGEVSLSRFRLLLALNERGRCPSSQLARALGVGPVGIGRCRCECR